MEWKKIMGVSWKERIKEYRIAGLYYLCRVFPIRRNKAVFCNYVGKGFGCNPKYIALELMKRGDWDIVWLTKDMQATFPDTVRVVKWDSNQAIYELATAGVWVDNQRKLWYHRKRKQQFFVETWHGGAGPIKKIGADNPANAGNKPYEHTSRHMDNIVNIMVSNGRMRSEIYRRAFLYTGEILECGAPRNDILVKGWEAYAPKIRTYFGLPQNSKIVIYAPTYRKGRKTDQMQLQGDAVLQALQEQFGGEWYMLKRLHPTMENKAGELSYNEKILNASRYDDMQELMAGADVLISDYSSVISEFSIMGKPIFLYAEDTDAYGMERDFYIDYFKLPYSVSKREEELIENIRAFNEACYQDKLKKYHLQIGSKELGKAACATADRIEAWRDEREWNI